MKLKLSEWASIAEVVSAVAVVISLLYVGYQISENTSEVRAANRQQLITRAHSAVVDVATSAELSEIVTKVGARSTLTAAESTQYGYLVRGVLYDIQEAFLLYQEGRLEVDYWNTRAEIVLAYLAPLAARDVYFRDRSLNAFHSEFVRWLDGAIDDRYGE